MNEINIHSNKDTGQRDVPEQLTKNFLNPEPRDTLFWLRQIRNWSNSGDVTDFENLLPDIDDELIARYIDSPRSEEVIRNLTEQQLAELREPQRIVLFYFLKKLAAFEGPSKDIISRFKNFIAEDILGFKMHPAEPETLIAFVDDTDAGKQIDIPLDAEVKGFVNNLPNPFTFRTTAHTDWQITDLQSLISTEPIKDQPGHQSVTNILLPLEEDQHLNLRPFKPIESPPLTFQPGLAIASEQLYLSMGERTITLTLVSDSPIVEDEFRFKISTEAGWLTLPTGSEGLADNNNSSESKLTIDFILPSTFPPIIPQDYPNGLQSPDLPSILIYRNRADMPVKLTQIALSASVNGLEPACVRNQETVLAPEGGLQLFGSSAPLNANFSFTDPELASKRLTGLSANLTWIGKPANLKEWYEAYPNKDENFTVAGKTTIQHDLQKDAPDSDLFGDRVNFSNAFPKSPLRDQWLEDESDPLLQPLYFQMELNGRELGESIYAILMTNYAIEKAKQCPDDSKSEQADDDIPEVNKPYIPEVARVSLCYESEQQCWQPNNTSALEVIEMLPVGTKKFAGILGPDTRTALGTLCLAFGKLAPGAETTVYFEGTPGNTRIQPFGIVWQYLSNTGWKCLEDYIVEDQTYKLTSRGLMTWRIPDDMTQNSTIMPPGKSWIRAIPEHHDNASLWEACMLISDIRANGIYLTRVLDPDEHEETNIPEDATLAFSDYPYSLIQYSRLAYGVIAENRERFWTRVFSQADHRNRAVTARNYNSLIQNNFGNVHQAITLPVNSNEDAFESIVIEKVYDRHPPYPKKRRTARKILAEIDQFIYDHATPFITPDQTIPYHSVGPEYIDVGFRLVVCLTEGISESQGRNYLIDDLNYLVNPWVTHPDSLMKTGCWFPASNFRSYLQSRPYIKALLRLKLDTEDGAEQEYLCPPEKYRIPRNVIPVFDERKLDVCFIKNIENYNPRNYGGIGYMIIDQDFYVGKP